MASIRAYLIELEARLAPSLDAGGLQERLTEAENHLRDRAQEFEEIGLPPLEAEARAVAAFGGPEEYTADVPPRPVDTPLVVKRRIDLPGRDVALQLAWSAVGLGLVSMLTVMPGGAVAAGAAAFFVFLGALFGRATSLWRLSLLSAVAALALFPVLMVAYVPVPPNSDRGEGAGIRPRNGWSWQDHNHQGALDELRTFERYQGLVAKGQTPQTRDGKPLGPSRGWRNSGPGYYGYGLGSVEEYDSAAKAKAMWLQDGDLVRQRLAAYVADTTPSVLVLTPAEIAARFAAISAVAGVLLMALLAGAQALGMALRALFAWLANRRPKIRTTVGGWEREACSRR